MTKKKDANASTGKPEAADAVEDAELVAGAQKTPAEDETAGAPREEEPPVDAADEPREETAPETADESPREDFEEPEPEPELEPEDYAYPPAEEEAAAAPHDEHVEHEHHEDHDENERRGTLAGKLLTGLLTLLVGASLALWAAPRVAPYLPASISKHLETGSTVTVDDLGKLAGTIDARIRAVEAKTLSVATVNELIDSQLSVARSTLDARVDDLADKVAAADSAAIEGRLSSVETALAGLKSELASLSATLSTAEAGAELTAEDAARIAGFAASVEGLRAEVDALSQQTGALSQKIEEVAAAAARRVEKAETEAQAAKQEAETRIKGAALAAALDDLQAAIASGAPYADKLATLAEGAGAQPPAGLAAAADTGAPSLSALRAAFPDAAHKAIRAAIEAEAAEGYTGAAAAWFRAQFTGLPVAETAGGDAPAVLSRVAARLAEGDLAAALAEAATLPEAAAAAFELWTAKAEIRRAALAGLAEYRSALAANG